MRRVLLAITLALFCAVHVASAYAETSAQSCSPDGTGFFLCSSGGLSMSGYVDRSGTVSGTIRGGDAYGNTVRGTITGDLSGPLPAVTGTATLYPSVGTGSITITTTCSSYFSCTTR